MRKRKGFTMVELMVVIIIMAILGLAIMPALMGSSEKAKYSRAWSDLDAIANAFTAYYGRTGEIPAGINGDLGGDNSPSGEEEILLQSFLGTPLSKLKDPWGKNRYQVKNTWTAATGKGYVIVYVDSENGEAAEDFEGFKGISVSISPKADPYNGGKAMAKLVINVM